ncbi:unnamed protein product [Ranitomeya imitator]|uniref:Core-binding (CB) domain-containing protein n=1 Tax=Ranitomeya imitator TaxID=111125 RepID=A0ABN9LIN7_9NEOB|nr:unnamed protein product [Ranitomeya imitator]
MIRARKPSSAKIYYRTWKAFFTWCESHGQTPLPYSLPKVLGFLQSGLEARLSLASLKGQVSALSVLFQRRIATKLQVKTFLQGVSRLVPPYRRPLETWDLNLVLTALQKPPFEPLKEVPLRLLSQKAVFLVAITSLRRVSELTAISCRRPFLAFHQDKFSIRKRHRNENSPSPRQSPKRRRDHSPESDAYNSGDEKNEKHRLLSQVVRPQDTRSVSPAVTEEKPTRWKEEERKPERKDGSRRYEEVEAKERPSTSEKQREHLETESSKVKETDSAVQHKIDEREVTDKLHEEKVKKKTLKKTGKKKKEEESAVEKCPAEPPPEEAKVFSPKKVQKKKNLEKKRKKGESDISDEDSMPQSKKKKGPRTPPVITASVTASVVVKEEIPVVVPEKMAVETLQSKDSTFSDWSDEDVPEKTEPLLTERTLEEPIKKPIKVKPEKEDHRPSCVDEPPARKPAEQKRSSSISSNQSRTSSRLRSPSIDSVHRGGDDQAVRRRLLPGSSKDRERNRSIEPSGERKSRIDQLKRGEPSRSTSSDALVFFINGYRGQIEGTPEVTVHEEVHPSLIGKFSPGLGHLTAEREHLKKRDMNMTGREIEKRKEIVIDEICGKEIGTEKLIKTGQGIEIGSDYERERDRRRDFERDREKLIPDNGEKERVRLLDIPSLLEQKRGDTKERDGEKTYEATSRNTSTLERPEKEAENLQDLVSSRKVEKAESVDGPEEELSKLDDEQSVDSVAGEEYEPISDGELEEILADDAEKKEDQHDEEKSSDPLDVIDVDWSSLMHKQANEPRESGAALLKFTPAAVLLRVGISKRLAGPDLFSKRLVPASGPGVSALTDQAEGAAHTICVIAPSDLNSRSGATLGRWSEARRLERGQDIVPVYQIKGISKLVKLCLPKVQCFCDSLTSPPSERQGRAKYACAGAVAEDQKRTSWKEDGRRRSGPETPIRPDQQRDRPWVTSGAYLQHYRMLQISP